MVRGSRADVENLIRNISLSSGLSEEQIQNTVDYLVKSVEEVLLQKILYIGDKIPTSLLDDERPKFIVLGTPQEFIEACGK